MTITQPTHWEGKNLPPNADAPVAWPDRSHRTVAEVWALTPEQVAIEQRQHEEPQQRDWRRE